MALDEDKGTRLHIQVRNTLRSAGLSVYGPNDQMKMTSFVPESSSNVEFEIDLIARIGQVAVFIEVTSQNSGNSGKIKKFATNSKAIEQSSVPLTERFSYFTGIPKSDLLFSSGISHWRYLYVADVDEIRDKRITPSNYSYITPNIQIWDKYSWSYIKDLTRLIGSYARYEIRSSLDISPQEAGDHQTTVGMKEFLKVPNRYVSADTPATDIYLLTFSPDELLRLARVTRYDGLPLSLGLSEADSGYQRILSKDKLSQIRKFITDQELNAFPTSLTLVLRPGWGEVSTGDGPRLTL